MKRKPFIALSLLIALVLCTIWYSGVSKAETTTGVKETISCTVDGVERTLTWSEDGNIYFKVKDSEPIDVYSDTFLLSMKFDIYGTCWVYDNDHYDENEDDYVLRWWNYDLLPDTPVFEVIPRISSDDLYGYVNDVESLIFDSDNKFIIGYRTLSGEAYAIPTPEDMETILTETDRYKYPQPKPLTNIPSPNPTAKPSVSPAPTPTKEATPATPTPVPTATPTNTEKPVVTPKPTVSPQSTAASKVSLKKQSGYNCLSVGNKVVSKYKLKKGVLTWKGTKSLKIKQVKQAGFIKKSKNLIYITKKGKAYTISQKGKKKTILKKGAKKLIFKNGYVTKVKKKSGYTNVANK